LPRSGRRAGRVDEALSLYEEDAVFVPEPAAPPISGHAAVREALARFAALKPTMTAERRRECAVAPDAVIECRFGCR
jgi:ketosteroid isomerase-like protein